MNGEIGRQCTEQAIRENRIIKTAIPVFLWKSNPESTTEIPEEIDQASFQCITEGDKITKNVIVKHEDFKFNHEDGLKKFYVG